MHLPHHIAIIMDGNGRWAKLKHLPRTAGHQAGAKVARNITMACAEKGIGILTLFAFGSENWQRPEREVDFLMNLFVETLSQELSELQKNNIRLRIIGDDTKLNASLRFQIQQAEEATATNTGLQVIIALNYSGRWDIVSGVKKLAQTIQAGELQSVDCIDEVFFSRYLSTADIPDPDLLVRTSGEQRLSNFILWQCAYTELYFTETLWPDFNLKAFETALDFYASRERRFGRTTEQLSDR